MLARRVGQQTAAIRACRYASQVSPRAAAEQHPHLHHVLGDQVLTMRTMDYITSPLDALAIVRAVERRFGRVAEYRFYRDAEISNRYQFVAHFAFWDPASYARVPKKSSTKIRVKVPPPITNAVSGGVGLADMAPFLEAQDWTENATEMDAHSEQETQTEGSRIIQFMVDHHVGRFQEGIPLPATALGQGRRRVTLAQHFVRWGGFAAKDPIENLPRITRSDLLFGGAKVDHPHMRHLLSVWSKLGFYPNTPPFAKPAVANDKSQIAKKQSPANPSRRRDAERQEEAARPVAQTLDFLSEGGGLKTNLSSPEVDSSDYEQQPPARVPEAAAERRPANQQVQNPRTLNAASEINLESSASDPSSPAPSSTVTQPPLSPATTQQYQPRPAANMTAKPAPERRNQARAARVVMHKVKPAEPAPTVSANGKATQAHSPPQNANNKTRKPKKQSVNQTPKVPERPIEVEERATGIAQRLKGMFGGWS